MNAESWIFIENVDRDDEARAGEAGEAVIAAKAAAFHEALQPSFREYIKSVLANAKILSET